MKHKEIADGIEKVMENDSCAIFHDKNYLAFQVVRLLDGAVISSLFYYDNDTSINMRYKLRQPKSDALWTAIQIYDALTQWDKDAKEKRLLRAIKKEKEGKEKGEVKRGLGKRRISRHDV